MMVMMVRVYSWLGLNVLVKHFITLCSAFLKLIIQRWFTDQKLVEKNK